MQKLNKYLILAVVIVGCSSNPSIDGFDPAAWQKADVCSADRIEGALLLEENEQMLQGMIQTKVEEFLGVAPRHELGKRSEKFFYYPIRSDCDSLPNQSLQIRFDALARVKEVLIVLD